MKTPPRKDFHFWIMYFLIMVTVGWLLLRAQRTASHALLLLGQKKQEQAWLARRSPALSADNESAIAQDVARASRELADLHAGLRGDDGPWFVNPPPTNSIDAFVDLATFKAQLRVRAAQAMVKLKPDEQFGFATHATEGPVAGSIAAVHRQRLAVQYLVEVLLETGPGSLLAVQRKRPKNDPTPDQSIRPQDFFEIPGTMSLRQAGQVETESFRLEFTGRTATLRGFLTRLASSDHPFVVRCVEVEPLRLAVATDAAEATSSGASPVPLTKPNGSRFTVTLELILPADATVNAPG